MCWTFHFLCFSAICNNSCQGRGFCAEPDLCICPYTYQGGSCDERTPFNTWPSPIPESNLDSFRRCTSPTRDLYETFNKNRYFLPSHCSYSLAWDCNFEWKVEVGIWRSYFYPSFNFLASKVINDYTCENEFCKRAVRIELLHHIVELLPDSRVTLDRKFYEIPAQLKPINLDVSSVGVWTIAKLGTSKHYCCNINIIVAISFYKMVARNKSSACFLPFHLKRFFSLCIWLHLTLILVNFFINYFAI